MTLTVDRSAGPMGLLPIIPMFKIPLAPALTSNKDIKSQCVARLSGVWSENTQILQKMEYHIPSQAEKMRMSVSKWEKTRDLSAIYGGVPDQIEF